jgi:transposase
MRSLLRHLRGKVHLVWDRGNTHKGDAIRALKRDYPRLTSDWLPPYAPELNPVEHVWNHVKYGQGANYLPEDTPELHGRVDGMLQAARRDPDRKESFFKAAQLDLGVRKLTT